LELDKARDLIENFFAKLKQYRTVRRLPDKPRCQLSGAIYLAASVILAQLMTRSKSIFYQGLTKKLHLSGFNEKT